MRQPDPDSDEHLFSRLRRIEAAAFAAASGGDRRLLLVLQNDLRSLLETLKRRSGQLAAKINRAGAQFSAARAYARCATLGAGARRKIIKAKE
jgi:hypothetical protein